MRTRALLFASLLCLLAVPAVHSQTGTFTAVTINSTVEPAATKGSGSLRVGGTSNYSTELGRNVIQAYAGNTPNWLKLNPRGGNILIGTGTGVLGYYPTSGLDGGACLEINNNSGTSSNNCDYSSLNLLVKGDAKTTGNLSVGGDLRVSKVLYVGTTGWSITAPDYVFDPSYVLISIDSLSSFVKANRHLPNVPSASSMENAQSVDLIGLTHKLMEKVEEQSLYIIELNNRLKALESAQRDAEGRSIGNP